MNEIELKIKFIDFLRSNSNHNFFSNYDYSPSNIIEIKNEGLNKKFDLILAMIKTKEIKLKKINNKAIEIDEDIKSIF